MNLLKPLLEILGMMTQFEKKKTIVCDEGDELVLVHPQRDMSMATIVGYAREFGYAVGDLADRERLKKRPQDLPRNCTILFYENSAIHALDACYNPHKPGERDLWESTMEDGDDLSPFLVCIKKTVSARLPEEESRSLVHSVT